MTGPIEIADEDVARIFAYLDGELPHEDMMAFEVRLAADPALAMRFESLASTDLALHAASARAASPHSFSRPLWFALAAASVLALAWWALRPSPAPGADARVVLVEAGASALEQLAVLDADPDLAQELGVLRTGGEPTLPPTELGRKLELLQQELLIRAPADSLTTETGWFRVGVRLERPARVALLRVAEGRVFLEHPTPGDADWPLLGAHELHFLPAPAFAVDAEGVAFAPGFRAGAADERWWLAVFEQPVDPGMWSTLVTLRPAALPEALGELGAAWLELEVR